MNILTLAVVTKQRKGEGSNSLVKTQFDHLLIVYLFGGGIWSETTISLHADIDHVQIPDSTLD